MSPCLRVSLVPTCYCYEGHSAQCHVQRWSEESAVNPERLKLGVYCLALSKTNKKEKLNPAHYPQARGTGKHCQPRQY